MRVSGPIRYRLSFDAKKFTVTCPRGTAKFSGPATSRLPKLYIVSIRGKPVYVGITKQPMRNRLRYGFTASGRGGYHGYAWRHKFGEATLDIWFHENGRDTHDIETVEAEVVFLIRSAGHWPPYQTEIHFHRSTKVHRDLATHIWRAVAKNRQRKTQQMAYVDTANTAPTMRWTTDPGAIPGEPFDYLDIPVGADGEIGEAKAVIIEIETPGGSRWEARAFGGKSLGMFETAEQARTAAETYVDATLY